jgi:hypothetical protein
MNGRDLTLSGGEENDKDGGDEAWEHYFVAIIVRTSQI